MLEGMKEPSRKVERRIHPGPSLAGEIARCRLKRRQGYRWVGLLQLQIIHRTLLTFDVKSEPHCLRRRSAVGWLYEASIVGKVRVRP